MRGPMRVIHSQRTIEEKDTFLKSTPAFVLAVHKIFDGRDNRIYNEMVKASNEYVWVIDQV